MRRLMASGLLLALLASGTSAHDFSFLEVSSVVKRGAYVSVSINNTVKGRRIICAVYDAQDRLVASKEWLTDNLATEALIRVGRDRIESVASARCAFN